MRRAIALLLLVVGSAGCNKPIITEDRISLDGPIIARVSAEIPATNNHGPVAPMAAEKCNSVDGPKIAIIDVDGLLLNTNMTGPYSAGENPVDLFREKLDATAADPDVCALVLRINTPGGAVAATDMMWRDLQTWRARTHRPVVACLINMATGGGYYLATASDFIIAHPMTVTGGIGVVLNLYNLKDFMGGVNIVPQPIKAGPNIDMGNQTRPLPQEAKDVLQAMADEFHGRFKQVVQQQRAHLDLAGGTTFDGRVFTAQQALKRGLIDQVGYLEDAVCLARQQAKRPDAHAVIFHRNNDPARTLYATTPNTPLQASLLPFSMPGAERTKLPTFLYLWEADPTVERLSGK